MLSLLLVASCQSQTITLTSCPVFTWPNKVAYEGIAQLGATNADFAEWFTDIARHGVICDDLNKAAL